MRSIRKILFLCALMLAGTLAASAQKDGKQKDPPPKEKPPVVVIRPKGNERPKENERPKGDENPRGKKPGAILVSLVSNAGIDFN